MKTRLFLLVIALVLLVGGSAGAQGGQICRINPTCYSSGCGSDVFNPWANPWLYVYIWCWNGSSWDLQQFRGGCCASA